MRRTIKWIGIGSGALVLVAAVLLGFVGVPALPGVATSGGERIRWRTGIDLARIASGLQKDLVFLAGWRSSGGPGIVVREGIRGAPALVRTPGARPEPIPNLDPAATGLAPRPGSPDSSFAYVLDEGGTESRRLYWYDYASGESEPITTEPAKLIMGGFDPGGERLAFSSTARNGEDYDLHIWSGGPPRLVLEGEGLLMPAGWSPDGGAVAVLQVLSPQQRLLHLFHPGSGELERLLAAWGDDVDIRRLEFSDDGRFLYFSSDHESEYSGIWRIDLGTRRVEAVGADIPWDIVDFDLAATGDHIVLLANRDGRNDLFFLDLESGGLAPVPGVPGHVSRLSTHRDRNLFAVEIMSAARTPEIHVYDADAEQWTLWVPGHDMGDPLPPERTFRYATFDSVGGEPRTIPATLYPGAGADRATPVVIELHGGPAQQAPVMLHPAWTVLRQRGVAVIQPNVRGSSGFGRTFTALDDVYGREDAVRDVGALLDWIRWQPELDAQRVAVTGSSYGGYMVLASLVNFPDRIACGVDLFGIADPVAFLEQSRDFALEVQRAEWGDERDPGVRAFLDSIAPVNRIDRIASPLLVFQGANDSRVKADQSRRMVEEIRAAGGEVWYIEASNEGHGIRSPAANVYTYSAIIDFLEGCLGTR